MRPEDIIIRPIITEESNMGIQEGKYTFKVNKKATKVDIANAVEKLFEVKVLKVNTITVKGKEKRVGRNVGKTSDWKKCFLPGYIFYHGFDAELLMSSLAMPNSRI